MPSTNFTMPLITSGLKADLAAKFLAKEFANKFPSDGKELKVLSVQRSTFSERELQFWKVPRLRPFVLQVRATCR